jgi:hypothetical protein
VRASSPCPYWSKLTEPSDQVVVALLEYIYEIVGDVVWSDVYPIVCRIVVLLGKLVVLLVNLVSDVLQDVVSTVLSEVVDLCSFIDYLDAADVIQVLGISH